MGVNVNIWNLMNSMRSVTRWQEVINSNVNGALKNGYKEADISFGGNTVYNLVSPTLTSYGKSVAEQSISIGYTRNIWKQGDLLPKQGDTDYAVRGEGFFMLTEQDPQTVGGQKIFYTRNGKFHIDYSLGAANPRLRTDNGLFVVDRFAAKFQGLIAGAPTAADAITNNISDVTRLALGRPAALDNFTYSKYGSTIYENIINNNNIYDLPEQNDMGNIIQNTLEASNVNMAKQITALSSSKQLSEAITKQFLVFYKNIDIGIELIK
ncbi:MAG: hypothetical protein U0354_03955 [Candidatus Sericytochromatia bacterium]